MANAKLAALLALGILAIGMAPLAHADPSTYNLSFNVSSLSMASGGSASVLASAIPQGDTRIVNNWQLQKVPSAITNSHAAHFITFNGSNCDGKPCTIDYARNAIAFATQNAVILKINTTNVTTGSYQLWMRVDGPGNAKVCVMLTGVEKDDCDNYDSYINITVGSLLQTPSLTISPNSVFPGQPVSINANEAGGIAPYTYRLSIFDSNDTLAYSNALTSSGDATFMYTPTSPGSYSASVNATDSATTPVSSVSKSDNFTVLQPPRASLSAPSNSVIDLGQYVSFGISVNDTNSTATGPFYVRLLANGTSVGTANISSVGGGNVTLGNTPTYAGAISFDAVVRDIGASPAFNFTSGNNTVRVNVAMHNQSVGIQGNTADVGEGINITASVLNGTAPYTYQFYIANAISNQLVANSIPIISSNSEYTYTYNAQKTGTYIANAVIRDGASTPESVFTGYTPSNVVVHTAPGTSNGLNSSIPGSIDVNQTLNVTLNLTGGIGPFSVNMTANGNVVSTASNAEAGSHLHLLYTPNMTGNVVLAISLTDYGTSTPYTYTLPGTTMHINPPLAPPNLNYSSITIDKGNAAPLQAISKNGTAPFNYTIKIYNDSGTLMQTLLKTSQSNVITINFTPTEVGMFKAKVTVRDSSLVNEISTSGNVSIRVVPALAVALTPNVTSVSRNQSVTFTGRITGGWPSYNYTVYSVNAITGSNQTQGFGINGTTSGNTITFNAIMKDLGANLFYLRATDNATFRATKIGEGAVDVIVTANTVNDTVKSTGGVKNNTPSILKVPPKNLTVVVATNSLNFTNVNITVTVANVPTNVITPTINGNATKPVQIVNITVVPEGNAVVTTRMNLTYDCSLPASSVAPYILKNYTWREITNFTIDTSACSVSFAIPNDPVIAVFAAPQTQQSGSGGSGGIQASGGGPIVGYPQPSTQPATTSVTTTASTTVPTTTPTTTAATTTVSEATTTVAQQQGSGSSSKSGSNQPGGKTGSAIPLLGGLAIAGAHAGRLRKRLKRRY